MFRHSAETTTTTTTTTAAAAAANVLAMAHASASGDGGGSSGDGSVKASLSSYQQQQQQQQQQQRQRQQKSRATPFPLSSLVPKSETFADAFVSAHPTFDGRNVTIGVLDTGVDPGAEGMSRLVDVVDCTGAGDVHVATEAMAELVVPLGSEKEKKKEKEGGQEQEQEQEKKYWKVVGLSGRTIRLNAELELRPFPSTPATATAPNSGSDDRGASGVESNKGGGADNENENDDNGSSSSSTVRAQVRLGLKRGYDFFPRPLVRRLQSHRRSAFDSCQRRHAATVRSKLEAWRAGRKSDPSRADCRIRDDLKSLLEEALEPPGGDAALEELGLDDPGPLYDVLVYHDGNNYRAILVDAFDDGRAVAVEGGEGENDTTRAIECDATDVLRGMTNFRTEREFGTLGTDAMLNYAVNFYQHGKVVSVVCDAGAHGSHVAGIAAGRRLAPSSSSGASTETAGEMESAPEDVAAVASNNLLPDPETVEDDEDAIEERNLALDAMSGVAPSASIVSLKIGDARLGSMETTSSLVRALIYSIRHQLDVINLSYGEGSAMANSGRFASLADEFVRRYGVVFVSSAGNAGPAISTVGCPGGMIDACLGVAAYVSPMMMKAQYSALPGGRRGGDGTNGGENDDDDDDDDDDALVGTTYTWSSVGPAPDGHNGVSVAAPGGAVTSVPTWTLRRNQLMNGTSMSSPHVAGCIALLLSACKASGGKLGKASPARIRRAIENTAEVMDGLGPLQQGWGMIRVDRAWEYLKEHKDDGNEDVYFRVRIENKAGNPRGVYLRQPSETSTKNTFSVHVDPKFQTDDVLDPETQRARVAFDMRFSLVSTEDWVKAPDHLVLMHGGKSFKIEVDPTSLPHGVHTARVLGYDSDKPGRGPMFSVPVTVIKTMTSSSSDERRSVVDLGRMSFRPAEVKRFFLDVPPGATYVDITVRDCRENKGAGNGNGNGGGFDSSPRTVVLHAGQLVPHRAFRNGECRKYLNLSPGQETVTSMAIRSGITFEVALARFWSTVGETEAEASVSFRGIRPVPEEVRLFSGVGAAHVRVHSDVRDEVANPTAKLTRWSTPLRPKPKLTSIAPLPDDERDTWPSDGGRHIHELVLTYEFEQEETGSFVPRAPALQGYLYESAYESQMMLIFDGDKKYIGCADAWPGEVKARKGTVTIRMQVRHDRPEMLEKLRNLPLWIERKMGKDIGLSVYPSHEAMMIGDGTMKKRMLRKGSCASVFIAEPSQSDLPKGCKCGDVLSGSVTYEAGDGNLPGNGKRPGGFLLQFVVGPDVDAKKENETGVTPDPPDERSAREKMEDAVKAAKVKELETLAGDDKASGDFEELYAELKKEYASHLPLLMAGLKFFDRKDGRTERFDAIIDAADEIVNLIPGTELAAHFGVDYDKEDPKSCKERKDMEEKKSFLVEALARKSRALCDSENKCDLFDESIKELQKWVDIYSDKKYTLLALEKEERAGRLGSVLKLLNDLIKNKKGDEKKAAGLWPLTKSDIFQRRAKVFQRLGFDHLASNDEKWKAIASPKDYALF